MKGKRILAAVILVTILSLPFYALANSFITTPSLDNSRLFNAINSKIFPNYGNHSSVSAQSPLPKVDLLPRLSLHLETIVPAISAYESSVRAAVTQVEQNTAAFIGRLADQTLQNQQLAAKKLVLRLPARQANSQSVAAISPPPVFHNTTPTSSLTPTPVLSKKISVPPQQNSPPPVSLNANIQAQVNKFLSEHQGQPIALTQLANDLNNLKALVAILPRSTIVVGQNSTSYTPPAINAGNIVLNQNSISTGTGDLTLSPSTNLVTISNNISIGGTITLNSVTYTWPSSSGSNTQVLQTNGSGGLAWATVSGAGSGTQTKDDGIQGLASATKINFSGNAFTLTSSSSTETIVKIDWSNGPASRSIAQTISGLWTFSGGATFSAPFELSSTASISGNLTVKGASTSFSAGSLDTNKGVHATGNVATIAQFLSTGAGSNSFAGSMDVSKGIRTTALTGTSLVIGPHTLGGSITGNSFNITGLAQLVTSIATVSTNFEAIGYASIGGNLTVKGASTSFSAGSLDTNKGVHATGNVATIAQFLSTGAGSNSFAGSLNTTLGIHATGNLTTAGLIFQTTTIGSNSFSGSLTTTKGVHTTLGIDAGSNIQTAGLFIGTNAGSNSFGGSLTLTKGFHTTNSIDTAGVFNSTLTTGSNSFAGSLELGKGIHATGNLATLAQIFSTGAGSNSFSGSLTTTKGVHTTLGIDAGSNIQTAGLFIGTNAGSNSFSGSLTLTKGLHATNGIDSSGNLQTSGLFIGTNAGSNSFGGSLTLTKGLHTTNSIDTAGVFNSTLTTGSNSFAGSLNTTKGVHATGNVTTAGLISVGTRLGIGTTSPTGAFTLVDTTVGSLSSGSFQIRANNIATGTVASISATGLTTGNVFAVMATTSTFSGNVFRVNAKNLNNGGTIFNFTVPASSSTNSAHGLMLVQDAAGNVIASWSMGGKLTLRSSIISRGSISTCTGVNAPAGNCIDYAETYPTQDSSIVAADLVAVDPDNSQNVVKATKGSGILGVVSTNPGALITGLSFITGSGTTDPKNIPAGEVPIALAGRVPVKVSTENGSIKRGDYLRVSIDMPGVAMKAQKAGNVIGQALENYSGDQVGQIMTFIEPGYYNGKNIEDIAGSFDPSSDSGLANALLTQFIHQAPITTADMSDIIADRIAASIEIISPKIYSDSIFANKLESRTGITTYDEQTGQPYCISVSGGQIKTTAGVCGSSAPLNIPTPSPEVSNSPDPSTPTPAPSPDAP